jgi:group I intron endonuclease
MKNICGIYKITSPSGRVYIGQSICIQKRFVAYKNNECRAQHKLKASFKKYGIASHIFDTICECNEKELNEKEVFFIKQHDSTGKNGLNISHGGVGVMRNRKHTDESKNKIRKAKVGLIHSEETKKKMSISRNKWKHTKESKQKMSDNMQRAKILNTETGEIHVGYNSVMPLINMKRTTFMAQLTGQNKNKTKYKLI